MLLLGMILLLAACSSPTATQQGTVVPVKSCTIPGFSCYVLTSGPQDVGMSLQNNIGTDVQSLILTINTTSCVLEQQTIDVGRMPGGAITPVHFTCTNAVPSKFSGTINAVLTINQGEVSKTLYGTISIKS